MPPERGDDPPEHIVLSHNGGDGHIHVAGIPFFGDKVQRVGFWGAVELRGTVAKRTFVSAERSLERFVAVPAKHLFPEIPGDSFRLFVEKGDGPVGGVDNDAYLQVVQDDIEVFIGHHGAYQFIHGVPFPGWVCIDDLLSPFKWHISVSIAIPNSNSYYSLISFLE